METKSVLKSTKSSGVCEGYMKQSNEEAKVEE